MLLTFNRMPHWTHYVSEKTEAAAMRSTRQRRPNFVSIQTKPVIKTPMIAIIFSRLNIPLSIFHLHHQPDFSTLQQPTPQIWSPGGLAIISRWHYSMLIDKLVLLGVYEIFNMENTWKTSSFGVACWQALPRWNHHQPCLHVLTCAILCQGY